MGTGRIGKWINHRSKVADCNGQKNEKGHVLRGFVLVRRLRQGLSRVARKPTGAGAARCGGDLGSPRKPAGPATCRCVLPVKARMPPLNYPPQKKAIESDVIICSAFGRPIERWHLWQIHCCIEIHFYH